MTLEREFDGASAGNSMFGSTRTRSSARSADELELVSRIHSDQHGINQNPLHENGFRTPKLLRMVFRPTAACRITIRRAIIQDSTTTG
jgi:hypothetical protein